MESVVANNNEPMEHQSLLTSLGRNFFSGPPFKATVGADFAGGMEATMHSVIYVIGLIVVVLLILSFLGLR
jgi:hypothetical protein